MRFLVIFLSLVGLIFLYLATEWLGVLNFHGLERIASLLILAIPFLAILWLVLIRWRRDETSTSLFNLIAEWTAFLGMGLISFTFVVNVARDVFAFAFYVSGHPQAFLYAPASFNVILAIAGVMLLIGVANARLTLEISRVDIPIENLPSVFENFKIAQISDLHVSSTIRSSFVTKVVSRVNSLDADIVVLTGDIVDGDLRSLESQVKPLSGILAKLGKFYITGNHEYYWGAEPWILHFRNLGFSVLVNQHEVIEKEGIKLVIAGVPDYMSAQSGGPKPSPREAILFAPKDAALKILLAHQPSFAKEASETGYDLQLSGHTHGGQFFPWTLLVGFFHQFPRGLGRLGKMWIYVNRGTGYWGPPVRLGSNPEITLIRLLRA